MNHLNGSSVCVEDFTQVAKILCDQEAFRLRGIVQALKLRKKKLEKNLHKIPDLYEEAIVSPFYSIEGQDAWIDVLAEKLWGIYTAPVGRDTVDNSCLYTFLAVRYRESSPCDWLDPMIAEIKKCASLDAVLIRYDMVQRVERFISSNIRNMHTAVFAGLRLSATPVYCDRNDMLDVLRYHLLDGDRYYNFDFRLREALFA